MTFSNYELDCIRQDFLNKGKSKVWSIWDYDAREYSLEIEENLWYLFNLWAIFHMGSGTSFKTNPIDAGAIKSDYSIVYEKVTKLARYLIDFCDIHKKNYWF